MGEQPDTMAKPWTVQTVMEVHIPYGDEAWKSYAYSAAEEAIGLVESQDHPVYLCYGASRSVVSEGWDAKSVLRILRGRIASDMWPDA